MTLAARADLLGAWHDYLSHGHRRSAHTVRAYVATAARLIDATGAADWAALAATDIQALRLHLADRRSAKIDKAGIGNVSAARELSALKAFLAFAREQAGVTTGPPRLRAPPRHPR